MAKLAPPASEATYKPLSNLAIFALILGLISPLLFLFDQFVLLLILPVPAVLLGAYARRTIRLSDGTLDGDLIATLAIVLGVACGLGWLTAKYTTQLIIYRESAQHIENWLQHCNAGHPGRSFLGSVRPTLRQIKFPPEDVRQLRAHFPSVSRDSKINEFDAYRSATVPSLLLRYPGKIKWEHLGGRTWVYDKGLYTVLHEYRISTPENEGVVTLGATSEDVETPQGKRREWRVTNQSKERFGKPTDFGKRLDFAQDVAQKFVMQWVRKALMAVGTAEAQKLNDSKSAAELERMLTSLRKDDEYSNISLRLPMLLVKCEAVGDHGWILDYHAVVETDLREAEVSFQLKTNDATKGENNWTIHDVVFGGIRKKSDDKNFAPSPPPPMRMPRIPG